MVVPTVIASIRMIVCFVRHRTDKQLDDIRLWRVRFYAKFTRPRIRLDQLNLKPDQSESFDAGWRFRESGI